MDSIGDYLYLIILVIAGLSSFLKKKKNTEQPASTPTKPKRSWEDVLKELTPVQDEQEELDEEFTIPEMEVVAPAPIKMQTAEIRSYENTQNTEILRAKRHSSQIKSANISRTKVVESDLSDMETEEYSFGSVEDAKRAFIYSEIFNRKY